MSDVIVVSPLDVGLSNDECFVHERWDILHLSNRQKYIYSVYSQIRSILLNVMT